MADLIAIVHDVTQLPWSSLGQQDLGHRLSFRDLYSVFGLVSLLAMFNATLVMSYLALGALKLSHRVVISAGKCVYVLVLSLQCLLGLAPVVLIARAWITDQELSLAVYGLPLLQLAFIGVLIFYQIRLIVMYARIQKLPVVTKN